MKVLKGIMCYILSAEWLGDDDADAVERAADPLPVPGLTLNLAGILRRPSRSRRASWIRFFQGGGYRRPPEAVSLVPDSRKGGTGHRQKSLKACSDRVSWPAFAKA